jgi:D-alanyl-lipoteichoic acid acyltransferase DltB (MBOAT superfamily)
LRTYLNLMVTMLLGGLWHGASWLYVFWGGLHGAFLAFERILRERFMGHRGRPGAMRVRSGWVNSAVWLTTLALLCFTWVFFRSSDFAAAANLLKAMFAVQEGALLTGPEIRQVLLVMVPLLAIQRLLRDKHLRAVLGRWPWPLRGLALTALLIALCLSPGDDRAFIYFQF